MSEDQNHPEKQVKLTELGRSLITGDEAPYEIVWSPMGSSNPNLRGPWLRRRDTGKLVRRLNEDEFIVK